jgi:TATA-box binding protein (TBP) (component of TFIID and TFIIIB)
VAFLLFGSGKVVCTGARKIKDVKMAVEKLEEKLRKAGVIK